MGLEAEGNDGVDRQDDRAVRALGLFQHAERGRGQVLLGQRLADADALRMQERVRHGAADHQGVDLGDEVLQEIELGRDLGAADDGDDGLLRCVQRLAERFQLGLHAASGIGGQLVGEAFGRSMRAMRRREGIIHIDVAERCELRHEARLVLLFLLVEPGVLQTEDVPRIHRVDRGLGLVADAVLGKRDGPLDDARDRRRDRFERLLGVMPFRAAEMRKQDHLAAFVGDLGNGVCDAVDARGVGDDAVLHRHVEVDAQEDAFVRHVHVVQRTEGHRFKIFSAKIRMPEPMAHVVNVMVRIDQVFGRAENRDSRPVIRPSNPLKWPSTLLKYPSILASEISIAPSLELDRPQFDISHIVLKPLDPMFQRGPFLRIARA